MQLPVYTILLLTSLAYAQTQYLTSLLQLNPDLSSFAEALRNVSRFAATLGTGNSNITILAPTNTAFEALLAGSSNAERQAIVDGNREGIQSLLAYHILNGTYTSVNFTGVPMYANTLFNSSSTGFETIHSNVKGRQNVGLIRNGDNPTVISGELQTSNIVEADIQTIPSITLHKIDRVFTIPLSLSNTLVRLPQLNTSAALGALEAVGFIDTNEENNEETLEDLQDITVFIPNNAAFSAVASIFQDASIQTLRSTLNYHAIQGSVLFASDVANTTVKTMQGNDLTLSVGTDSTIYVDNARVLVPNILLSNGVAHIIDAVLNPDSEDINRSTLNPTASPAPAFSGASSVGTDIPFTSSVARPTTTVSIPSLATTAMFVAPGGATATTGTVGSSSVSRSSSATGSPQSTSAARRLEGGLGAAVCFGLALVV